MIVLGDSPNAAIGDAGDPKAIELWRSESVTGARRFGPPLAKASELCLPIRSASLTSSRHTSNWTLTSQHNVQMEVEKHEAIGQRGEACIILFKRVSHPDGQTETTYSLATGERLRPALKDGEFVTLDGRRSFNLRR